MTQFKEISYMLLKFINFFFEFIDFVVTSTILAMCVSTLYKFAGPELFKAPAKSGMALLTLLVLTR